LADKRQKNDFLVLLDCRQQSP